MAPASLDGLRVLVLTARDWTHPQAGGSGENLFQQAMRWRARGAQIAVVAGGYHGGARVARVDGVPILRLGTDETVFAHAASRGAAGRLPAADVVLEIVSGVFFLTPLWRPRTPRVVWLHHVHREQYVEQYGPIVGRTAGFALETVPVRTIYRHARMLVPSRPVADALVAAGADAARVTANHNGLDLDAFAAGERAAEPTLLALGRLRRYKRVHLLLDVLEQLPGVVLEVAGDGDQRAALEADARRSGLEGRVRFHGFVDAPTRLRLLQRAWLHVTASAAEGWGMTVTEAGACATPTAALAVGGLTEAIVDGRTGVLATDVDGLAAAIRDLLGDPARREAMGAAARARAATFSWERTADVTARALLDELAASGRR